MFRPCLTNARDLSLISVVKYSFTLHEILKYERIGVMNKQHHIAKKISNLRKESGMSQEELGKKVSLSRVAVSDIENDKRTVSALELSKISEVFQIHIDYFFNNEIPTESVRPFRQENIRFEPAKLKNTLLYLLERCGGKANIGETVIYKLLYYIDFNFFEQTGKSITGLTYVKLQYGPVPLAQQYLPLIKQMIEEGSLKIIAQNYYGKQQKRYVALMNCDIEQFTPKELKAIEKVADGDLSSMSASQIENYVHQDAPWMIPKMKEVIPYEFVMERKAPFAFRDYDQMWRTASAKDILKNLGHMPRAEYDYYESL